MDFQSIMEVGCYFLHLTYTIRLTCCIYVVTGTFLVYAAINLAGIVFIIIMVPETKGRTLEQIQAAINN